MELWGIIKFMQSIDQYFLYGFGSAMVSYLYYTLVATHNKEHMPVWQGIYGTIISGFVGGFMAMALDRSIYLSIVVGFMHQIIYMAMIKTGTNKRFFSVLSEMIVKLFGGVK